MIINNELQDFGYIINYSVSNLLKKEDFKNLEQLFVFCEIHIDIFQKYQLENLSASFNMYLYMHKQISNDKEDLINKWLNLLTIKKDIYLVQKSFEVVDDDMFEFICLEACENSLNKDSILYFCVPNFIKRNKNCFTSKTFIEIQNLFKNINNKNGIREKKIWEELCLNTNVS